MKRSLWIAAALAAATPAALDGPDLTSRVLSIGESSSERLQPDGRVAPGQPPLLMFRYLDGKRRHRFGDLDLVMDDAGH
ncbi:MAG: hypothetical protein KDC27_02640 [Acidobacteria bacterium]|nr:hypothetical protein [Acidobacteriota bacterium]